MILKILKVCAIQKNNLFQVGDITYLSPILHFMAFHGISWDDHNQVRNIWWHVRHVNVIHGNKTTIITTIGSWFKDHWKLAFSEQISQLSKLGLLVWFWYHWILANFSTVDFYCVFVRTISRPNAISHTDLRHFDSSLMLEPSPWTPLAVMMGSFIGYLSVNFSTIIHYFEKHVHQLH